MWHLVQEQIFPIRSTELLFNPYNGIDMELDLPDGDLTRRANLRSYLESFPSAPPILLVGEAPGPRGCRFSGVPFTSEAQLISGSLPFTGRQSSRRSEPYAEYSAASIWSDLLQYYPRFLLWNCVPLHPHRLDLPLSIRTPGRSEVRRWAAPLGKLVKIVRPELVVAIGRKAEDAFSMIGVRCVYLRHPSQGGLRAFREGLHPLLAPYRIAR